MHSSESLETRTKSATNLSNGPGVKPGYGNRGITTKKHNHEKIKTNKKDYNGHIKILCKKE